MKNTFALVLLFTISIKSNSQFNTIDQYGPSILPNGTSSLELDTVQPKIEAEQRKIERKPELLVNNRLTLPLKSLKRNSSFGGRIHPVLMSYKVHSGIDLRAFYEPVYSVAAGVVIQSGFRPVEGNFIKIKHGTIESIYCHLSKLFVGIGDKVEPGAQIGISGNTGRSTGPHLHFGLKYNGRFINPELFLALFNVK